MALNFSIDTDLEGNQLKGYRAIYKFHIAIKNDKMQSVLLIHIMKVNLMLIPLKSF